MSLSEAPAGPRFGPKIRALRRRHEMTQAVFAERLGVSASYLNLIENGRRPLPAGLLVKLAETFDVDVRAFAGNDDARIVSNLLEVFADPLFEGEELSTVDVREMASASPQAAHAVLMLYRAYKGARGTTDQLVAQLTDGEDFGLADRSLLPSEEVSDLIQTRMNYFPELEKGAESLRDALGGDELAPGLTRYLERSLGVRVQVGRWADEPGTLRRYDPEGRVLLLSELLPTRARTFELAHQIALLVQRDALDALTADPALTTAESRSLGRVALANYFAAAVLMPYDAFLRAAREERNDVDVIGRRFRVGFEQVCHRLTTLRKPQAEGVPFHMIRIDAAGNISKRFSASGIRFARFSGACVRWNIFSAFQTPGMIRVQLSRMPENETYFCIARTIQKDSAGYHAQQPVLAIGLGCDIRHAPALVYADGVSLEDPRLAVSVGVTCRTCERTDCDQRALPSLKVPLRVDENRRGISLYAEARRAAPKEGTSAGRTFPDAASAAPKPRPAEGRGARPAPGPRERVQR
jgi:predicted transcriptional regulator/DNA-binding XRE family transcriptional regulator